MRQSYQLIIRDRNVYRYRQLASFLFGINAAIFLMFALRSDSVSGKIILCTVSFIMVAYAFYNWKYKTNKEKSYIAVYLLAAAVWALETPFWYFSVVLLLLLILQYRMEKDFIITFNNEDIVLTSFPARRYAWPDFNNIVLRDGLLTMDFKNNRVMQVEPDWNNTTGLPGNETWDAGEAYPDIEKEFNEFCKKRLAL